MEFSNTICRPVTADKLSLPLEIPALQTPSAVGRESTSQKIRKVVVYGPQVLTSAGLGVSAGL